MPNSISRLYGFLPLLIGIVLLLLFPRWTVDDAFISYRYAANWLETGEWLWNQGEPRVEGFTGYALPWLAALFMRLGIAPESGMQYVGAIATLSGIGLLHSTLRGLAINPIIALLTSCLYALLPLVYVHACSGLETSVFTCAVIGFLWALTHLKQEGEKTSWTITCAGMALLLALIRPEGILLAGIGFGILFWQEKADRMRWLVAGGLVMIGIAAFQFWRWQYFGSWLPNSVMVKTYSGWINAESIKDFLRFTAYYAALPLGLGFLMYFVEADSARASDPQSARARKRVIWVGGLFLLGALAVYFRSQLFMNYAGRFFVPLLPWMLIVAAHFADLGWQNLQQSRMAKPRRWRILMGVFVLACVAQGGILAFKWKSEWAWVLRYRAIVEHEYKPAAQLLKARLQAGQSVACYMDAGAIPYFSRLKTIDFGRLNDPYLARVAMGSPEAVAYFFERKPDAAVFTSHYPDRYVYLPEAHMIHDDPRFDAYKQVAVFAAPGVDDYFQFVYLRDTTP